MIVDILDDDVSIMNTNNKHKVKFIQEEAYLEVNTESGTFTDYETITGGTSGSTARVKFTKIGHIRLLINTPSAAFTIGETVTGTSSSATAVVTAYVPQKYGYSVSVSEGQSHAILLKNQIYDTVAEDFKAGTVIDEGSWLSCSLLDDAGAGDITIQIELESTGESVESRK